MTFPEKIGGDPIVIDDLCAISFVPQFKGYYVVVVCSMSSRRIKVHVNFTQCSRYCVFYPSVGSVPREEMIAELTITPYRIRNIGIVGPDSDGVLFPYTLLFSQLKYITQVFVENEQGNMIAASKFRRNAKMFVSSLGLVPTFSSTTFVDMWPVGFSSLRANDFIIRRRNKTILSSANNSTTTTTANNNNNNNNGSSRNAAPLKRTKRASSEGLENPRVVLYTDEIADGAAYLISAVNKSKTPYSLLYQISSDASFPNNNTVGTSTSINSDIKEIKSSTFYFVPMDGWECEPVIALKGYLPGNGDVALGWVVRRDVSMEKLNSSFFLYRCTVMPCKPDNGQLHSQQITRKRTEMTMSMMMKQQEQQQERCLNHHHNDCIIVEGRISPIVLRESKSVHSKNGLLLVESTGSRRDKHSIHSKMFPRLSISPTSPSKTVMKMDLTKQDVVSFSKERCSSFSPDPLPSRCLQMEDAFMKTDNVGEETLGGVMKEPLLNNNNNNNNNTDKTIRDIETYYMHELHMSLKSIRAEIESQIEEEVQRRLSSAEITLSLHNHYNESMQNTPQSYMNNGNNTTIPTSSITTMNPVEKVFLNTSPVISHALRRLEGDEAIKRISIETSAISERRLLLQEWQLPQCIICGLPVSAWSLAVQDPVNGNKTHFLCYTELRKQL